MVISRITIKEMSTTARVEELTLLVGYRPLGCNQLFQGGCLVIGFEANIHATVDKIQLCGYWFKGVINVGGLV